MHLTRNLHTDGVSARKERTMKGIRKLALAAAATVAAAGVLLAAEALQVDPKLSVYEKTAGISGNLSSIGSDTMNNLATLWAEGFRKYYPNVKVQVEGKGSSTAPPGTDRGHGPARPDVAEDEEGRDRQVRGQVRLPADRHPHGPRRHRRLRQQGQPAERADARAGRRDLLEDAQGRPTRKTSRPGARSA